MRGWGDRFWGRSRGVGDNVLGQLLMELRESLKAGSGRVTASLRDTLSPEPPESRATSFRPSRSPGRPWTGSCAGTDSTAS